MTYNQVVQKWGLPSSFKQDDHITVARWVVGRRVFVMIPMAAIPAGVAFTPFPLSQQWQMELTFDRTTERLTSWTYESLSLLSALRHGD